MKNKRHKLVMVGLLMTPLVHAGTKCKTVDLGESYRTTCHPTQIGKWHDKTTTTVPKTTAKCKTVSVRGHDENGKPYLEKVRVCE
ncbi:hypothetical protein [Vibrio sp. 10N.261.51.F12]|uniref:hypothetical protein n=1 Tax=Vibrio sp. 10N.261.51.F12 TaxID=3229679 RepID=UPI00354D541F